MTYIAGEANIEMELHGAGGEIGTKATYDIGSESYNATATVNSIIRHSRAHNILFFISLILPSYSFHLLGQLRPSWIKTQPFL